MPAGRPSSYDPDFVRQAKLLTKLGATDREVAEFFEVTETTLHRWKHAHEQFRKALKTGKAPADDRVEQSLYRRAVGYSFDAVKIFPPKTWQAEGGEVKVGEPVVVPYVEHVPPDTTACIFWLKNRRPDLWRDKREFGLEDGKVSEALAKLAERLPA